MATINQTKSQTVRVTGKGETKQKAFASALSQIQKKVIQDESTVTLQITPIKVLPIQLDEATYKEHFLFFFFPRIRKTFTVTIDVEVALNTIDIENLPFHETNSRGEALQIANFLKGGK